MTADPPVGERELNGDGWPVGMTREQILAAAGVPEEEARRCQRLAALSGRIRGRTRADWYRGLNRWVQRCELDRTSLGGGNVTYW
jgi:hypothetical protein